MRPPGRIVRLEVPLIKQPMHGLDALCSDYGIDLFGVGDRCWADWSLSELRYMAFMVAPRVSWPLRYHEAAMTGTRIVAILVGIGIIFALEYWLSADWYVSIPLGIIGYLVARYIGWAINERRRLKRERDQLVKKVMRQPGGQNSN